MSLANRTVFITGASRGIGLANALRAAAGGDISWINACSNSSTE